LHDPTAHAPAAQRAAPLEAVQPAPHAPQLPVLVRVSTQPPAQHVSPAEHPWLASQPGTHAAPMQSVPGGQCSLVTHATQVCEAASHRRAPRPASAVASAPASPAAPTHPSSLRHPAMQVCVLSSQWSAAGHVSAAATHCTQRPAATSQTVPAASPAQSALARQGGRASIEGPASAAEIASGRATTASRGVIVGAS
jgi:hypothetical protein